MYHSIAIITPLQRNDFGGYDGDAYYRIVNSYRVQESDISPYLVLWIIPVLRRTPKSVWLDLSYFGQKDKRIIPGSVRSFAYADVNKALESFVARKYKQLEHLNRQLSSAKGALKLVDDTKEQLDLHFERIRKKKEKYLLNKMTGV